MQWTIGKKLYAGITALTVVTVAMAGVGIRSEKQLGASVEFLSEKVGPNIGYIGQMRFFSESMRSATRLTVVLAAQGDVTALAATREKMKEFHDEFTKTAKALEQNHPVEAAKEMARASVTAMDAYVEKCDEVARLAGLLKPAEAAEAIKAATPLGTRVQQIGSELLAMQEKRLVEAREDGKAAQEQGDILLLFFAALALVTLAAVGLVVRSVVKNLGGMVNNLRSGSEQVSSASTQVAASAQTLSQGSTEQAASLEETSASMEEMASMTRKNAENSQQAAQLMSEVDRVVEGSNKALGDMTHSMTSIRESSNKVSKIIKTIDEIAFQTNILALNAAVEAARAGEAGMGFAVVADEVRNLAQRSAQAAKDTAALIEESIANSQEGNAKVEIVAQSIAAITVSVAKVKGLVTEVSEASRQQSQGIDQVAQAVAQMEKVTQSTAASAEESAAASEELSAQAETTMAEVARLEAMVVGSRGGAGAHRAPTRAAAARVAGRSATLLKLPTRGKATPSTATAEDEIPFGDTGTYGKF